MKKVEVRIYDRLEPAYNPKMPMTKMYGLDKKILLLLQPIKVRGVAQPG